MKNWLLGAAVLALVLSGAAWSDEPKKDPPAAGAQAKELETLIGQLGDADYAARKKATERLAAIGGPALAALKKVASTSKDPEVRWRAETLISRIEGAEAEKRRRERGREEQPPGFPPMPGPGQGQMPDDLARLMRRFHMELRGFPGGGQQWSWSSTGGEQRLQITEGGTRYEFVRARDGSFTVKEHKGTSSSEHKFKDEEEMKKSNPGLHAAWKRGTGGIEVRPLPLPPQLDELRRMLGRDPFREMQGMREMLERSLRELERALGGQPFQGLPEMQEEVRRARERLRQMMEEQGARREQAPAPKPAARNGLVAVAAAPELLAQLGLANGVLVGEVEGGLAAKLGLARHDVVTSVNGKAIGTPEELHRALAEAAGGETVKVGIVRKAAPQTLEAKLK